MGPVASATLCDPGSDYYQQSDGLHYRLMDTPTSLYEAEAACKAQGARLAMIKTDAQERICSSL